MVIGSFLLDFWKVSIRFTKERFAKRLKAFGLRLREVRESKDMSQEELADHAQISYNSLNRIENGKLNPTLATLLAISESLKINVSELLDF